ncbi:MAG: hypothetical protein JXR51_00900 [Bacteroidales bacterium]|nr:hypothetical protein [Bacteroidales bacterium]MBN2755700.1 hypothetical protein [Bacteroidales bacterium]
MNKYLKLIIFLIFISITFHMCKNRNDNNSNSKNQETDTNSIVENKKLNVEDYDFAIMENRNFIQYNKAIYQRGDEVYFVLKNVGEFVKGADSLNNAEMKLEVYDAIGQLVMTRSNLFGSSGHANFENNILKAPYASYSSSKNDKIGKYSIKVTVYDIIKNDSISISDDFFLE